MHNVLPTVADVVDAHVRLRGWLVETPLLESQAINDRVGARVLFKAECLQHSGSFKIRGALNRLLQLSAEERQAGVVAFSSGNHAQAVALAARWLEMPATIVMPADAPKVKLDRTRAYGAEVVLYDREREDREAIAVRIARATRCRARAAVRSSACHRGAGLARVRARPSGSRPPSRGRGALCAVQRRRSRRRVRARDQGRVARVRRVCRRAAGLRGYGGFARRRRAPRFFARRHDVVRRSARARCPARSRSRSIAASSRARAPSTTSRFAPRWPLAAQHLKVVVEPSGAAALAAVLAEPRPRGRCIAVVLSGGNVDPELFAEVLRTHGAQ